MKLFSLLFESENSTNTQSVEDMILEMIEDVSFEIGEHLDVVSLRYGGDFNYKLELKIPSIDQIVNFELNYPSSKSYLEADKKALLEKLKKIIRTTKMNEESFVTEEFWEKVAQRIKDYLSDSAEISVYESTFDIINSPSKIGIQLDITGNWDGPISIYIIYDKQSGRINLDIWYEEEETWHKKADLMDDFDGSVNRVAKWIVQEIEAFSDLSVATLPIRQS